MADPIEPIGLVAGWGRFPVAFAEKAKSMGIPIVCVGIKGMADREAILPYVASFHWTRPATIARPIRIFKKLGVKRYMPAGKILKSYYISRFRWLYLFPDWMFIKLWFFHKRKDNADDTLTLMLLDAYTKAGLTCCSALELCPELLVKAGTLTKRTPTDKELADIEYGWHLAKEMGRLDIGQSVCIRDRAALAIEAIEGTDACIRRAGELAKKGAFTVVKVAKPKQDMRFDVPAVGPSTIQSMKESGGKVLAIEAEKTIVIDEAETIRAANDAGICIVSRAAID
jgi:UDP-2,3-diacylglucosamine hydrolase